MQKFSVTKKEIENLIEYYQKAKHLNFFVVEGKYLAGNCPDCGKWIGQQEVKGFWKKVGLWLLQK